MKKGSVLFGIESSRKCLKSIRNLTNSGSTISDDEVVQLYRRLLRKLEIFYKGTNLKPLKSIEIIKTLLQQEAIFSDVEFIIHCICTACIKISVESVVESLVSRHENHSDTSRQMSEDHTLEEMLIAENGPLLYHAADPILRRATDKYLKNKDIKLSKWHFVRKTNDIRKYTGGSSKVIGKILDTKSKLPFMDQ